MIMVLQHQKKVSWTIGRVDGYRLQIVDFLGTRRRADLGCEIAYAENNVNQRTYNVTF